jgi:carboxypeptidase family protein
MAQGVAPDQKPGSISGHIYRADTGEPIAKAIVMLEPLGENAKNIQFSKTDVSGDYTFPRVEPGKYNVGAEHSGFLSADYDDEGQDGEGKSVVVDSGRTLDKIDLRLMVASVISGSVVDEDNQPIKGLQVSALEPHFQPGGGLDFESDEGVVTYTDDLGHFRLSGLEAGSYIVLVAGDVEGDDLRRGTSVRAIKYGEIYYPNSSTLSAAQRIRVAPGAEIKDIDFALTAQLQTYTVSGTVSNIIPYTIRPPSIEIRRPGKDPSEGWSRVGDGYVKPDGSFMISGVPAGEYLMTVSQWQTIVSKSGFEPSTSIVAKGTSSVRVLDQDVKVNIMMERPGEVRGTITWEAHAPPEDLKFERVWLRFAEGSDESVGGEGAQVDQDGAFDIRFVAPGRYKFAIFAEGAAPFYLKQAICSGEDYTSRLLPVEAGAAISDCTITLAHDTGVISGLVLDGDKPVRGFEVVAIPESTSLRRLEPYTKSALMTTNSKGQFTIAGLIPGDYLLFAVPSDPEQGYYALDFADRNASSAERVTVKSGESKTVNLKPTANPQ